MLQVDTCADGTPITLAVYLYGNPNGFPVVHLHGGPGSNVAHYTSKYYDLKYYYLVMFDQRGCGNSKPRLLIENDKNTTQRLIEDIERIRVSVMCCEKWLIAGGSWGSSLAVLYAQAHPSRTAGLLLRGFTDLTTDEINNPVFNNMFTDNTEEFFRMVNLDYKKDSETKLVTKLYKRFKSFLPKRNLYDSKATERRVRRHLTKKDHHILMDLFSDNQVYTIRNLKKEQKTRAQKIRQMTLTQRRRAEKLRRRTRKRQRAAMSKLGPCASNESFESYEREHRVFKVFADALITYHYGSNNFFIKKNQIISKPNVDRICNIPTIFVQGRFDIICPFKMTWEMHKRLNKSELLIAHGGHTNYNNEVAQLLCDATDKFKKILKKR